MHASISVELIPCRGLRLVTASLPKSVVDPTQVTDSSELMSSKSKSIAPCNTETSKGKNKNSKMWSYPTCWMRSSVLSTYNILRKARKKARTHEWNQC